MNGEPNDPLLRVKEIMRLTGKARTSLYYLIHQKLWPPMVKVHGTAGMYESELRRMMALAIVKATKEEIRQEVQTIVGERIAHAQAVLNKEGR